MKYNAVLLWLGASITVVNSVPLSTNTRYGPRSVAVHTDASAYVKRHDAVDDLYERDYADIDERDGAIDYDLEERDYDLDERDLYDLEERDLYDLDELEERDLYDLEERDFSDLEERDFYDLEERDFDDLELEERQIGAAIKVAEKVAEGIIKIVDAIKGRIQRDKDYRSKWTYDLVGKMHAQNPHFNYILCHTSHKAQFDGVRGRDWGHSHQEIPVSFGKTIGYEIYWGKSGKFQRYGDGGFLNWAYIGNVKSKSGDGKTITFGKP